MNLNQEINYETYVSDALNKYLGQTRLSMEQVARKWDVSSAMLSLVRNNKKSAGIDLGLKILREAGINPSKRKIWLEKKVYSLSDESKIVEDDLKVENKTTELMGTICEQLGQSKILLDIFLDITLSEELGLPRNALLKDYGKRGLQEVSILINAKICRFENNRFIINSINNIFSYDSRSTFEVVNNLIREQRLNFLNDEFKGKLEFDVTDITEDGYKEILKIQKEYQANIRKVLNKNQSHRRTGGVRVFSQSIISVLKTTAMMLALVIIINNNTEARGGVTGTAGDDRQLPTAIKFGEKLKVRLGNYNKLIISGSKAKLGNKTFKFRESFLRTEFHDNKEDAVRDGVEKQFLIAQQTDYKSYQKIISNSPYKHTCAHYVTGTKKAINKNFFRFKGFKIEESYDLNGKQRFNAKVEIDFLCKDK